MEETEEVKGQAMWIDATGNSERYIYRKIFSGDRRLGSTGKIRRRSSVLKDTGKDIRNIHRTLPTASIYRQETTSVDSIRHRDLNRQQEV